MSVQPDHLSFDDAFSNARTALGAGKIFTHQGKQYTTWWAGEAEAAAGAPVTAQSDHLSFGEAFSRARSALGAGRTFTWQGKPYTTWWAGEEEQARAQTAAQVAAAAAAAQLAPATLRAGSAQMLARFSAVSSVTDASPAVAPAVVSSSAAAIASAAAAADQPDTAALGLPIDIQASDVVLDLRRKARLGNGGQGDVVPAEWAPEALAKRGHAQQELAAKRPRDHLMAKLMLREGDKLLALPRHPNVMHLVAICREKDEEMLIYKLMQSSFFDWLHPETSAAAAAAVGHPQQRTGSRHSALSPAQRLRLMRQGAAGVAHLHRHKTVHRDIKSANFLVKGDLSADGMIKLSDLGIAMRDADATKLTSSVLAPHVRNMRSPLRWRAPEVVLSQAGAADRYSETFRSDVYSFGVVMYEIETGQTPHVNMSDEQICDMHRAKGSLSLVQGCAPVAAGTRALIERCLHWNPVERPTADMVERELNRLIIEGEHTLGGAVRVSQHMYNTAGMLSTFEEAAGDQILHRWALPDHSVLLYFYTRAAAENALQKHDHLTTDADVRMQVQLVDPLDPRGRPLSVQAIAS